MAKKSSKKRGDSAEPADIFGGHGKATIPEIKARLAELEKRQREEREQFLADQAEPIRQRIILLQQQRREIDQELNTLNNTLAELSGKAAVPSGNGRRTRMDAKAKLELAAVIFKKMADSKHNKFKPSELEAFTVVDGHVIKARELVAIWNDANKDDKAKLIHRTGEKANTRYHVG